MSTANIGIIPSTKGNIHHIFLSQKNECYFRPFSMGPLQSITSSYLRRSTFQVQTTNSRGASSHLMLRASNQRGHECLISDGEPRAPPLPPYRIDGEVIEHH